MQISFLLFNQNYCIVPLGTQDSVQPDTDPIPSQLVPTQHQPSHCCFRIFSYSFIPFNASYIPTPASAPSINFA